MLDIPKKPDISQQDKREFGVRQVKQALQLSLIIILQTLLANIVAAQVNDPNAGLVPITEFDGPALEFEFPGVHIGIAEYPEGPTGTTVFYFPDNVMAVVDVRGGAPGAINTDALRLGYETSFTTAIALSGGSSYGLGAATGASQEIKVLRSNPGWWSNIAVVSGAIIFDLGGRRYNAVTPDERLGRAAVRAARPGYFPLGARGAGRFAMQGWFYNAPQHSGQGAAYGQFGEVRIATFTVVNSLGGIVNRSGRLVRCGVPAQTDCPLASSVLRKQPDNTNSQKDSPDGLSSNTTISLVITNQKLSFAELQRFAMQTHTSMARSIQPFHTIKDGDTLFAVSTAEVEATDISIEQLGVHASELMWDAVLASAPPIPDRPKADDRVLTASEMSKYPGTYEFASGMQATLMIEGQDLVIRAPERESIYLPSASAIKITPASNGDFVLDTQRADVIRFESDNHNNVKRLIINPGPWPVVAVRTD